MVALNNIYLVFWYDALMLTGYEEMFNSKNSKTIEFDTQVFKNKSIRFVRITN